MATLNGSTYKYVNIINGDDTLHHRVEDAQARHDIGESVEAYGKNLYNPDTNELFKTISDSNGELVGAPAWDVSDWIPVIPGEKYYIKIFEKTGTIGVRYAQYNSSKEYIQRVISNDQVRYIQNASNTAYIRLIVPNMSATDVSISKLMVTKSETEPQTYYPYYTFIDQSARDRLTTAESDIDAAELRLDTAESDIDAAELRLDGIDTDISETNDNIEEIRTAYDKNLYNPETNILGKTINENTGELQDSPQWDVSDWIPVEPGYRYYIKIFEKTGTIGIRYAQYDSNKGFIGRTVGTDQVKLFTPTDTAYIRLIVPNASVEDVSISKLMVTKSETEPQVWYSFRYTANDMTARDRLTAAEQRLDGIDSSLTGLSGDIDDGLTAANKRIDEIRTAYGKNLYNPETNVLGKTIDNSTGELTNSPQWDVSDWISVETGQRYYIKIFEKTGTVSIRYALYDSSKGFLGRYNYSDLVRFFAPVNAAYMRVIVPSASVTDASISKLMVTKSTVEPQAWCQYYTANDMTARENSVDSSSISVSQNDFSDNIVYYSRSGFGTMATYTTTDYKHSAPIPVTPGRRVKISNGYFYAKECVIFLDVEGDYFSHIDVVSESPSGTFTDYTFDVPAGARYFQYNITNDQLSTTAVEYVDTASLVNAPNVLLRHLEEQSFGQEHQLLKQLRDLGPRFSLVDDDTASSLLVKRYHDIVAANDCVGNYATVAFRLEDNAPQGWDETTQGPWDGAANRANLLAYEEEGFGIHYHCNVQINEYRTGSDRDAVKMEKDFVQGLRRMRNFGFCNYSIWLSPFGITDAYSRDMAIRHGMIARFCTNQGYVKKTTKYTATNLPAGAFGRYYIPRFTAGHTEETLEAMKAMVDQCVADRGWIILTTHVNMWYQSGGKYWKQSDWDTSHDDYFDQSIKYCLAQGMTNINLMNGLQRYMPLYQFDEMH